MRTGVGFALAAVLCIVASAEDSAVQSDDKDKSGKSDTKDRSDKERQQLSKRDMFDSGTDEWHFHKDWVSEIIQPEHLQPFWLMPIFFGVKSAMTTLIFGFSLKFREDTPIEGVVPRCISQAKRFGKALASIAFICMAINAYFIDYVAYTEFAGRCTNTWQKLGVFLIVWATSPNYVATMAVWGSLKLESPMSLFGVHDTTYTSIPFPIKGFPLFPGTSWLDPLKHIYAYVLMPYFLPEFCFSLSSQFIVCYMNFKGGCALAVGGCKAQCLLCAGLFGCLFSLCLWQWARDTFHQYFMLEFPIWHVTLLMIYAALIVPFFLTVLFASVLKITSGGFNLAEQLKSGLGTMFTLNQLGGIGLEEGDRRKLKELNQVDFGRYFKDYNQEPTRSQDVEGGSYNLVGTYTPPTDAANTGPESLEDTKIAIFGRVLMNMANIVVQTLTVIWILRAAESVNFEEYASAAALTLNERHAASYFSYMRLLAQQSKTEALNAIWLFV